MNIIEFLKDKILSIFIILLAIITIEIFMMAYSSIDLFLKIYVPVVIFVAYFIGVIIEYLIRNKFYKELYMNIEKLDKKYLIRELIECPNFSDGNIVRDVLQLAEKSMAENVNRYKNINSEYQEYIELWIHEVKMPIAVSKMIIENNPSETMDSIDEEIEKIDAYTEQALYYARSSNVDKDYILRKSKLEEIVNSVILKNRRILIGKKIKIDIHDIDNEIYSDSKWIQFILNQIIQNSIKYSKENNAIIEIYSEKQKERVIVSIKDNGIGIDDKDIGRVFEKGFTGQNGRNEKQSTGIGLYLCKKLCIKLGHDIEIKSKIGEGTLVNIYFPIGSFNNL